MAGFAVTTEDIDFGVALEDAAAVARRKALRKDDVWNETAYSLESGR